MHRTREYHHPVAMSHACLEFTLIVPPVWVLVAPLARGRRRAGRRSSSPRRRRPAAVHRHEAAARALLLPLRRDLRHLSLVLKEAAQLLERFARLGPPLSSLLLPCPQLVRFFLGQFRFHTEFQTPSFLRRIRHLRWAAPPAACNRQPASEDGPEPCDRCCRHRRAASELSRPLCPLASLWD